MGKENPAARTAGGRARRAATRRSRPPGRGPLRGVTPWLFLLAPLVLLITFTYVPVANMV